MRAAIRGGDVPGEIVHRPRQSIEIVGERRSKERDLQADAGCLESVDGVQWGHFERNLLHCRNLARVGAHVSVRHVVDADQAGQGLFHTGPMASIDVSQMIGHGPDAEIRIVGHQGYDRRPLLCLRRQCCEVTRDYQAKGEKMTAQPRQNLRR